MNNNDLKILSESLINTFNFAGKESIRLYKEGLKIEIKKDKSPVSSGDLKVNEIISNKESERFLRVVQNLRKLKSGELTKLNVEVKGKSLRTKVKKTIF